MSVGIDKARKGVLVAVAGGGQQLLLGHPHAFGRHLCWIMPLLSNPRPAHLELDCFE
jgi:hypothetical protein